MAPAEADEQSGGEQGDAGRSKRKTGSGEYGPGGATNTATGPDQHRERTLDNG